jgi:pantoate--beta-alanine ligase
MQICRTVSELRSTIDNLKLLGKKIGFVPTMGALHQGHMSLCKEAKMECDVVVVSIFVNPTQFNNPEDLAKYPRTETTDLHHLNAVSCDIVFLPAVEEMYPFPSSIVFSFGNIEQVLEGAFRPGHFSAVATVVSKLFHLVQPHLAYFGQKDLQQYLIIEQLVNQLSFPVILKCCPIVRAESGLALSSRNARIEASLLPDGYKIYQSLVLAKSLVQQGEKTAVVKSKIRQFYNPYSALELEYFEIVERDTLQSIEEIKDNNKIAICVAAYLGNVRLIDNILL